MEQGREGRKVSEERAEERGASGGSVRDLGRLHFSQVRAAWSAAAVDERMTVTARPLPELDPRRPRPSCPALRSPSVAPPLLTPAHISPFSFCCPCSHPSLPLLSPPAAAAAAFHPNALCERPPPPLFVFLPDYTHSYSSLPDAPLCVAGCSWSCTRLR